MTALAVGLSVVTFVLGLLLGRAEARTLGVFAAGTVIFLASVAFAALPELGEDPRSRHITLVTAAFQIGLLSVAIHVLPFVFGVLLGKRRGQGKSSA